MRRALHYVPCVVRGRMVAVVGPSSEDVDILLTVSCRICGGNLVKTVCFIKNKNAPVELKLLKEFDKNQSSNRFNIQLVGSGY